MTEGRENCMKLILTLKLLSNYVQNCFAVDTIVITFSSHGVDKYFFRNCLSSIFLLSHQQHVRRSHEGSRSCLSHIFHAQLHSAVSERESGKYNLQQYARVWWKTATEAERGCGVPNDIKLNSSTIFIHYLYISGCERVWKEQIVLNLFNDKSAYDIECEGKLRAQVDTT